MLRIGQSICDFALRFYYVINRQFNSIKDRLVQREWRTKRIQLNRSEEKSTNETSVVYAVAFFLS